MRRLALALLALSPLAASCGGPDAGAPTGGLPHVATTPETLAAAVAVVEGEPITAEQVARQAKAAGTSARVALDALIEAKVLAREAERRGLHADEQVIEAGKREMVRRFLAQGFEVEATAENTVTEPESRRAYEMRSADLDHPELQVVLHILAPATPTDPPAVRDAALKRAQAVADKAKTLHDEAAFRALADAMSDKDVKLKGEELATTLRGMTVRPFAEAAFTLKNIGDSSGVVETMFGFHVIFLKGKIAAVHIPIEEVRGKLRDAIWPDARRRAFARYLDGTVDKHHIETFTGLLQAEHSGEEAGK